MESTGTMPVLFVGHGSPMNALENNEFTAGWQAIAATISKPKAILCISAHWETRGTMLTGMAKPKTIHDFGGFPQALYDIQYPAPGSPELAREATSLIKSTTATLDDQWGLDHGTWSIVRKMYPDASVPVIQMSLDYTLSPDQQYQLAQELTVLRSKGILILGSGNLVHNLRILDWSGKGPSFDWADEANSQFKKLILARQHRQLIDFRNLGASAKLAIPTAEHFLPLLCVLAMQRGDEPVSFFNDKITMGSLSMTSVKIG